MSLKTIFCSAILTLASTLVLAQSESYEAGQQAIRAQDWDRAIELMVAAEQEDEQLADATWYWRAFALCRSGRQLDGRRALRELNRHYPQSDWRDDGEALASECGSRTHELAAINDDPELRLFKLSQLMHQDPERAIAEVRQMLSESDASELRRQALFVVGMSNHPQAREMVVEMVRNSPDLQLRREAVHMLGMSGDDEAIALLTEIYQREQDTELRRAVLHAYLVADADQAVLDAFEVTADDELRREIIQLMGVMDLGQHLTGLYQKTDDLETRRALIEALMIANQTEALESAYQQETDPELRRTLFEALVVSGGSQAPQWLSEAYDRADTIEEKEMVLEALVMVNDAHEVELARRVIAEEQDLGLRTAAIEVLGLLGRTDLLKGLYSGLEDVGLRQSVLESLAIAGDVDQLIEVIEEETEPNLRIQAIEAISITGSTKAANALIAQYAEAPYAEREATMEALMVLDDVEGLLELLAMEQDDELRRQLMQTISLIE